MKTVRTAIQLLTLFSPERPALTVSGAASHFGLSASASSRLLSAMATAGLIQRGPDRAYRPGPLAYKLGLLYHSHNQLADLVNGAARKIVGETGLTCWVSVLTGGDAMLISRFPGPADQGFHVDAGNLLPAHASAGGKALLSRLSDDRLETVLTSSRLAPWTPKTKTDLRIILSDIRATRERGWSIIVDELFEGVTSVGVALSSPKETTPMALSVSIPSAIRSVSRVAKAINHLVASARDVASMIADPAWGEGRQLPAEKEIVAAVEAYVASKPKRVIVQKKLSGHAAAGSKTKARARASGRSLR
ncbi:MAG TPA: IclR family transcriptional regulator C-terminal domain-containing protein [Xanthobacteraceae bacterium]|nr:IclR family transcriptional regulator C-terminal domain-containing protein [Xanthobacteraceae bacterium]